MKIDKLAYINPKAKLGKDVEVGPFSFIDQDVSIGDGTIIKNSVTVTGKTVIGKNNKIYHNATIGSDPQDFTFKGENTELIIGNNNLIREYVTINLGTKKGGGKTIIGNKNFIMACAHIAHDCIIEDNVVIANSVLLGGHIKIEKNACIMGLVGIHPFVTVGQFSYIGGLTRIVQDVPPFMIVEGHPSKVRQVNVVGLQRGRYKEDEIGIIKDVYKRIFRANILNLNQELESLEKEKGCVEEVKKLIEFLRNKEKGKYGRFRESLR